MKRAAKLVLYQIFAALPLILLLLIALVVVSRL